MASHTLAPFPDELLAAKKQIREQARSYGLDFFNVIFEMCDYEQMNQIAAYGGFPQRYPHFFKNNLWFSQTNRKMMDEMANHATRVRKHIEKHGYDTVERWLDICLSVEHLIDPHSMFLNRGPMEQKKEDPKRE